MSYKFLRSFFEAHESKIMGAIRWEMRAMHKSGDTDSWIREADDETPAIQISYLEDEQGGYYRAVLYPSFRNANSWYVCAIIRVPRRDAVEKPKTLDEKLAPIIQDIIAKRSVA